MCFVLTFVVLFLTSDSMKNYTDCAYRGIKHTSQRVLSCAGPMQVSQVKG